MLARAYLSAILGIDGFPLSIEVDNYPGLNKLTILGLPDAAVPGGVCEGNCVAARSAGRRPGAMGRTGAAL